MLCVIGSRFIVHTEIVPNINIIAGFFFNLFWVMDPFDIYN